MKKLMALICLGGLALSSVASPIKPFSTHFFLQQNVGDRDTVHLVECPIGKEVTVEPESCQQFGNEEGYSLALIEALRISESGARWFAENRISRNGVGILMAKSFAIAFIVQGISVIKRKGAKEIVGVLFGIAAAATGLLVYLENREDNHFHVKTYKEVGKHLATIDFQEQQTESVYASIVGVRRGLGQDKVYKREVKRIRNSLVHLLKSAKIQ